MKDQSSSQTTYSSSYNIEDSFSLFILQNTNSTKIKMMIFRDPVNTVDIPNALDILKNYLPSVLTTECFNDEQLPFYQEVKRTEIGHLFEHILLEYMCQLKIAKGHKFAVYAGRTRWNWERDPRGLFHININCTQKDSDILPAALEKSIALMKIILLNNPFSNSKLDTGWHQVKPGANLFEGLKNGKKLRRK